MTAISSTSQARLARVATRFSGQVAQRLAEVKRTTRSRLDRIAAERAAREREQKEKQEKERQGIAKRMPLARCGLARLLAVGRSEPIQQIISDLKRIQRFSGALTFYEAHRYSGDAFELPDEEIDFSPGTCDVEFQFREDHLQIFCGSYSALQGITWEVGYNPPKSSEAVTRHDVPSMGVLSVDAFLTEIANPYPINMGIVSHWRQRCWEWDPGDIAFQLLVSCTRPSRLDNYLKNIRPAVPV